MTSIPTLTPSLIYYSNHLIWNSITPNPYFIYNETEFSYIISGSGFIGSGINTIVLYNTTSSAYIPLPATINSNNQLSGSNSNFTASAANYLIYSSTNNGTTLKSTGLSLVVQ